MRTIPLFLLFTAAALAQDPGPCLPKEKTIPCYVRLLQARLADYRKSVDDQIKSEKDVTAALAEVLAGEAERNVYEILSVERADSSFKLAADLAEERATPAQMRDRVRDIAMREFQMTRQFYESEMALLVSVLPSLKSTELDIKKLDALNKAMTGLSAKPELKTQLADMVGFAREYQTVYQQEVCKDFARTIAVSDGSIAALRAQLADTRLDDDLKSELQSRLKLIEARKSDTLKVRTARGCQ